MQSTRVILSSLTVPPTNEACVPPLCLKVNLPDSNVAVMRQVDYFPGAANPRVPITPIDPVTTCLSNDAMLQLLQAAAAISNMPNNITACIPSYINYHYIFNITAQALLPADSCDKFAGDFNNTAQGCGKVADNANNTMLAIIFGILGVVGLTALSYGLLSIKRKKEQDVELDMVPDQHMPIAQMRL